MCVIIKKSNMLYKTTFHIVSAVLFKHVINAWKLRNNALTYS